MEDTAPSVRSPDKVAAELQRIREIRTDDPQINTLLGVVALVPDVASFVPQDPAQLDQVLETLATWALSMRSDDAARKLAVSVAS